LEEKELMVLAAVLQDKLPSRADAIFVHAANDLQYELLTGVADFYHCLGPKPKIVFNGLDKYETFPGSFGSAEWKSILCGPLGVKKEDVILIPPAVHTGREAEECISLCAKNGWKNLIIAARPVHILRCFLTSLGVTRQMCLNLKIYCFTIPCAWNATAEVYKITGIKIVDTNFGHLIEELERIKTYHDKYVSGDPNISPIASFEEGLKYFLSR